MVVTFTFHSVIPILAVCLPIPSPWSPGNQLRSQTPSLHSCTLQSLASMDKPQTSLSQPRQLRIVEPTLVLEQTAWV